MKNTEKIISKGNLEYWKQLQDEKGYFEHHPIYNGFREFSLGEYGGLDALEAIKSFQILQRESKVVVIGCGYGRETLQIAPLVHHVWGIDVSEKLLSETVKFLAVRGISNFTPVLAENYRENIPSGIDLVFSVVVMQHLSRELVRDYFLSLGQVLSANGSVIVQFLEELYDGVDGRDAEARVYEPSVSWTLAQLASLSLESGLKFNEVRTQMIDSKTLWHWVHFSRNI